MARPVEPLEFREEILNGEKVVYAAKPWPNRAIITEPTDGSEIIIFNDKIITIRVQNGFASYQKIIPRGEGWYCIIGESEYLAT